MSGFTDRFGGSILQPADVAYRAVALTASQVTFWPPFASATNVLARQMDVTPSAPGFSIALPDATLASPGENAVFRNVGASNFVITDFSGVTIYTLTPGQVINIYLTSNTTTAGVWGVFILGAGTASLDLSNAAGNGLVVAVSRLAVSPIVSAVAGNRVIASGDRATAFIWTGGTGTFTLPLSSTVGQFFFEVRNQGTGALTIATTGGELIDASASIALQLGESALVHAATGAWYTVGRGRSTQFAFTQLQKVVTGGTVTETLTEAANVVQTFTGVLTSNVDIVVPAVVQVYYVSNQTSGAFNFRVKNPGAGTTVSIPTGQNAVLFSDGTNVINASTTLAGISSLVLAAGSAGSPSLGVGAVNSGLFSSGSNEVAVSANSLQVAKFDPTGLTVNAVGGQVGVNTASGNASFNLQRPAGAYGVTNYYTAASQRWRVGVNNTAEAGANAGSDFFVERYNDAGASLGIVVTYTRSTGAAAFGGPLSATTGTFSGALAATTINGTGTATITTTNSTSSMFLLDTGTNGSNLKFTGDGAVTPSKFIRVKTGVLEFINSAYTVVLATLTDAGVFTAVNVGISSDRKLKKNIRTHSGARERLRQLRGTLYERRSTGKTEGGLIAQEVQKLYPHAIGKDGNGNLTVDPMAIIADLVQAWSEKE